MAVEIVAPRAGAWIETVKCRLFASAQGDKYRTSCERYGINPTHIFRSFDFLRN
ncbi:MAG: hypothetical protein HY809_06025 [Nitrospirae bacterium]|nr:hypothetical protein [Nitrospirota bacterium]